MELLPSSDQKYNLRWPDYHNSVLATFRQGSLETMKICLLSVLQCCSYFRSLKEEEDFVDVTLSCEESQYTAHKVVLSACSPYFRKLLKVRPGVQQGRKSSYLNIKLFYKSGAQLSLGSTCNSIHAIGLNQARKLVSPRYDSAQIFKHSLVLLTRLIGVFQGEAGFERET